MDQTDRDFAYLEMIHKSGKAMGLSDADLVRIAKTQGDIDPEAMKQYEEKYK
jgi:hypothetical protein